MPTLHWIGKEKVVSHHQDLPYGILEHQYGFSSDPKQHKIWEQLRSSSVLNYLDLSERETIIYYAEKHGVVPMYSPRIDFKP